MKEKIAKISYRLSSACLNLAFLLTPIFFLPFTSDFFNFNKQVLFLILTSFSLVSWLIYTLLRKTVRLTLSPMLLPILALPLTAVISTLINSPQLPDQWLNRPILYSSLAVYYLLSTTLIRSSSQVKKILKYFLAIVVVLALLGIVSVLGLFSGLSLPAYLTATGFSPAGSLLNLVSILIITLPLILVLALTASQGPNKLKYFLASGLIISAIILVGYQLLPNQAHTAVLLPKLAGWSIAIDTFKSKALFGAGPGHFINQFTLFKPISLNLTPFWAVSFAVSANEYLHLMTTLGLAGLITFTLIVLSWLRLIKRRPGTRITATQLALNSSLITIFLLGLFIPFQTTVWIILVSFLAFSVGINKSKNLTKVKDVVLTINAITVVDPDVSTPAFSSSKIPSAILPILIAIPTFLALSLSLFSLYKLYLGDYFFARSLVAAKENRGSDTYNLQIKALRYQPKIDRYHLAYSNTNLALANALAEKPDLTDQQKQTISQLISQSIREARTAVEINPGQASNWANLANLYSQLINFAQGADNFAVGSYIKAIQLDPANPQLRLQLGGLLYSLERFDEAINRFNEAIQLKPNYPNAYYNLSYAYQKQDDYLNAYQAMQQVLTLTDPNSDDFAKAQTDLKSLEAKLPAKETSTNSKSIKPKKLSSPTPPPSAPSGFDKINLDEATSSSQENR